MSDIENREPIGFAISSGDLIFRAVFADPVFALLQNVAGLCQELFNELRGFGVTPADIKLEGAQGTAADMHVLVSLFSVSTVIRVRLDSAEVHCLNILNSDAEQVANIAGAVLEALKRHHETVQFRVFTLILGVHGVLEGVPVTQFVDKYTRTPAPDLGPLTGSGAVFYYGAKGDQLQASLTIDHSASVQGGLFLRPTVAWDASKQQIGRLRTAGTEFFESTLRELGLARRDEL